MTENDVIIEKRLLIFQIDQLSSGLVHIESEKRERMSVWVEEEIRMRVVLPFSPHFELIELKFDLILLVESAESVVQSSRLFPD